MSIIGSSWKEVYPSDENIEEFNRITGGNFQGTKKDLEKQIKRHQESGWSSRKEVRDLRNLEENMNQNID
jgi:hypothetical protein